MDAASPARPIGTVARLSRSCGPVAEGAGGGAGEGTWSRLAAAACAAVFGMGVMLAGLGDRFDDRTDQDVSGLIFDRGPAVGLGP